MDIPILYEDDSLVVINKPAGVLVHEDGTTKEETIASWHAARVPEAKEVGEPLTLPTGESILRPGVVHRLDRETSGVMVLAKTQEAFLDLKTQFHDRLIEKVYRAFVYGTMKDKRGMIDRPIGRSATDFRLRSAQRGAKGLMRDAVTYWEVIVQSKGFAYLSLRPKTGRTHQLRVHLKAINHPIVGDELYAKNHEPALGFPGLALHAYSLTLTIPGGGSQTFTAPLPPQFEAAEAELRLG